MFPDQLGSIRPIAQIATKTCPLAHGPHSQKWPHSRQPLQSRVQDQSLRQVGLIGASGFPTVPCNMFLLVVLVGAPTIMVPFVPAGVFGCQRHPGSTRLIANAALALEVATSQDARAGVLGCPGRPGRTLQSAHSARTSKKMKTQLASCYPKHP